MIGMTLGSNTDHLLQISKRDDLFRVICRIRPDKDRLTDGIRWSVHANCGMASFVPSSKLTLSQCNQAKRCLKSKQGYVAYLVR